MMTPTYTQNRQRNGGQSRYTYYYRCTKTYKHDWKSCTIKTVNADKIERFVVDRLKAISQDEGAINRLIKKTNQEEEQRLSPLKQQERGLLDEIQEVEKKIKNLVDFLANISSAFDREKSLQRFPSITKELENLENKKKVLEYDLEGVRLAVQKEAHEKFEAKIVLDILKDFAQDIEQIELPDKPYLFQQLIKSITYGREKIGVDIFYLPEGYLPNMGQIRARHTGRADEVGEVSGCWRLNQKRGRRAEEMGEAGERSPTSLCLKKRPIWLPPLIQHELQYQ